MSIHFYSVAEVAKALKIAPEKVRRFISSGQLQAMNVATNTTGRPRWRISREALNEFESNRRSELVPRRKPVPKLVKVREYF